MANEGITNILGDVADTDGKTLKIELDQYGQASVALLHIGTQLISTLYSV